MDWKLELVVLPVSDVDRAKAFYAEQAGFTVDVDVSAGADFRVVQLTPPGSACSVALMRNDDARGSVQGLHLIVEDIEAARDELANRGTTVSDFFHYDAGGQKPGLHPERGSPSRSSRSATRTATAGWSRRWARAPAAIRP